MIVFNHVSGAVLLGIDSDGQFIRIVSNLAPLKFGIIHVRLDPSIGDRAPDVLTGGIRDHFSLGEIEVISRPESDPFDLTEVFQGPTNMNSGE